jgi:membrane protease YdiL (CAAX protease family)
MMVKPKKRPLRYRGLSSGAAGLVATAVALLFGSVLVSGVIRRLDGSIRPHTGALVFECLIALGAAVAAISLLRGPRHQYEAASTGAGEHTSTERPSVWPEPTARSRTWTVRYALAAYAALWVLVIAVALLLHVAGVRVPRGPGILITESLMLVTMVPLYRRGAVRPADLGFRRVHGARSVGLVLLALIVIGWLYSLWAGAVHPPATRTLFQGLSHQGIVVIVLSGFAAAIAAPVVEEIFFRGLLYRSLRNRMGILPASVTASILFAAGHTQYPLSLLPDVAFFGVAACLLYEHTGSLLPGIAMHSYIDASAFNSSLTGNSTIVTLLFLLLAAVLLLRPPLKGLVRLIGGNDGPPRSPSQTEPTNQASSLP